MDASMYSALFDILAPIGTVVLIGYWIAKASGNIDTVAISRIVMLVGTPALVFSTLTTTELPSAVLLQVSLGSFVSCIFAIAFAWLALKLLGYSSKIYLPSLTMPNSGNLGLPLTQLAFGDDGLAFGIAFYFVIAIFQYCFMPLVVIGKFSLKTVLKEPLIWAVAAAMFIILSDTEVPKAVANTTELMGGMMIPVMLILLGGAIARLGFGGLKTSLMLAVLRLGIGLAAGICTILLLGTTGIATGTIFIMAAMPSALVTYVLAARYHGEADEVAGLVVSSTVITLLILPLLLWCAIHLAETY